MSGWAKLTDKERDAIIGALGFVTAGVDPWEHDETDKGEGSEMFRNCYTAWAKLTDRMK